MTRRYRLLAWLISESLSLAVVAGIAWLVPSYDALVGALAVTVGTTAVTAILMLRDRWQTEPRLDPEPANIDIHLGGVASPETDTDPYLAAEVRRVLNGEVSQ